MLGNGFNLMADSLQEMIRRIQKSGLQINTSATEIAATAQEQLSTASEVAATTSEIGATSKEISATSRQLAQTLKQISQVAEKTADLAGSGQMALVRMKSTMQHVVEASATIHTRLGVLSEQDGQYRQRGHDHNEGGGPDQPSVTERRNRGREGRRPWPRVLPW